MGRIIDSILLPKTWMKLVLTQIQLADEVKRSQRERKQVEERLRRLREVYLGLHISSTRSCTHSPTSDPARVPTGKKKEVRESSPRPIPFNGIQLSVIVMITPATLTTIRNVEGFLHGHIRFRSAIDKMGLLIPEIWPARPVPANN